LLLVLHIPSLHASPESQSEAFLHALPPSGKLSTQRLNEAVPGIRLQSPGDSPSRLQHWSLDEHEKLLPAGTQALHCPSTQ
jgi:hypothetical protein